MTAVDHAELKRLAEGAGGDEWGLNDWRPEGQILVCGGEGHSYGLFATVDDALPDVAAFIAAANPAVVLAVLSEIEGLKADGEVYQQQADHEFAKRKEAERQLAALRTQAPDSWRPDREAIIAAIDSKTTTNWWDEVTGIEEAADAVLALCVQKAESGK